MTRTTVLLADDHAVVAEGLASLLRDEFEMLGTVTSGDALIESAVRLRPDVIVTDVSMPGVTGLEATRRLRSIGSESRVIVLTMHDDPGIAAEAFRAGAAGFVMKHSAGEELILAIRTVAAGHAYL